MDTHTKHSFIHSSSNKLSSYWSFVSFYFAVAIAAILQVLIGTEETNVTNVAYILMSKTVYLVKYVFTLSID